jgi:hypothetical protein
MKTRRLFAVVLSTVLVVALAGLAAAAAPPKTEIKGAAILDHPCGKVAAKHMSLVHAGKMADAVKLGTPEMQKEWMALPASDRDMMTKMMQATAKSDAEFSAAIKAAGVLEIAGDTGTLTITQEHKDANGSSTETFTEQFKIDGATCWITH